MGKGLSRESIRHEPGSRVSITVSRGGSEQTFSLVVPSSKAVSADSIVGYPKLEPVVDDVAIGFPAEQSWP